MQQGTMNNIDAIGKKLSIFIHCPIRWTGHDKNMFVCHCDVVFPAQRLQASDDWSWVKKEHDRR